jgi:hypothetical protein
MMSSDDEDCCAFTVVSHAMMARGDSNIWYADTGASEHMTDRRDWFSYLKEYQSGQHSVMVADDHSLPVQGKGDINIERTVNGITRPGILKNVLYIPDLKRNLFSIGQATELGLSFFSTRNKT